MARTPTVRVNPDGWSPWFPTVEGNLRLCCCDCGLTHDFQTRVLPDGGMEWRVAGNARATAAHRRWTRVRAEKE